MQEALAKILNVNSAEFTTIGAVTFVDIAWHYSMADPAIWDHFQGPAASHMVDAIQNLDVLKASLGSQAGTIFGHILTYFKALEATQVFHDGIAQVSAAAGAQAAAMMALNASGTTLLERLSKAATTGAEAKVGATADAGLLLHLPVVTIGFASYRAWRRSQGGAGLGRNLEFAAIEVATRTGGGLFGAQVGGALGTAVVPGAGTVVGGIAGAVAGAIGGAILGEEFKQRHVKGAQEKLEKALNELGEYHLQHPGRFRELTDVFTTQENEYERNLSAMQRRLLAYSLLPWRMAWPNEKLVLLQETVKMARQRLDAIKKGALDAVDQLTYMRGRHQHREMGLILWNDAALRRQLTTEPKLVGAVGQATEKLRHEVTQHGALPQGATA
jgi:outer membrane lipoprotein SlyB